MVNRATVSYVVMIVLFIVGQWAVVEFGTRLHAAPYIGGTWTLSASSEMPNAMVPGSKMTVNQSGQYLEISFDNGLRLGAKLNPTHAADGKTPWDGVQATTSQTIFLANCFGNGDELHCFLQVPNWVTLPIGPVNLSVGKSLNDFRFDARKDAGKTN
jgi:hypothetical protein